MIHCRGRARHAVALRVATLAVFGDAIGAADAQQSPAPPDSSAAVVAESSTQQLPPVEVHGNYLNSVGSSDAASAGTVTAKLVESRPTLRPAEVLEFVPGVIVTQHSGDGKANQYYLRGFNLDHGTDFATFVDGMPVSMPTHARGQGYSDLNWLIPELVDGCATARGRIQPRTATSRRPARRGSTSSMLCRAASRR
jgi:outer membrane cobalamin receptor